MANKKFFYAQSSDYDAVTGQYDFWHTVDFGRGATHFNTWQSFEDGYRLFSEGICVSVITDTVEVEWLANRLELE